MDNDRGRFDEGATTAPLAREAPYASQEDYGYGGSQQRYGYGQFGQSRFRVRGGYGRAQRGPTETRPFFLTSEFLATVLAIVALGITAAAMDIVDARLTWILTAAMVFAYVMSRGLAKAGSDSRAFDPRDELLRQGFGDGGGREQHQASRQAGEGGYVVPQAQRYGGGYGRGVAGRHPLETRPFFLTSEFAATVLAILAVALTAAAMPNLGARLTWILIASLVATYAVSRGLAKAGTRSHSFDPREELLRAGGEHGRQEQAGPAQGGGFGPGHVETKPFFVTSEFVGMLLAIVAIAISAATIDVLNVRLTWILITVMVGGYVLSRGIAKIGVKSHSLDPRDELLRHAGGHGGAERNPAGRA